MSVASPAAAQVGRTVLVLPFENQSKASGIDWIGEAFAETLDHRLAVPSLFVIGRDERNYAFDRLGIPAHLHPSRATMIRIAEELDADYLVFGNYNFDGKAFSCNGYVLDMKRMRLLPPFQESGPLVNVVDVQTALAWDVLRSVDPLLAVSRQQFVQSAPPVRLDAFESFIRGVIATDPQERVRYLQSAVKQNPSYSEAMLELAKTYFAARDYEDAVTWFAKVPKSYEDAREANFYLGLSAYYVGQFDRADAAFSFVAEQLPLTEVFNNLGVVNGRRGKTAAEAQYFQKAVEADPKDADYRFNFAVALYKLGNVANATKELQEAMALRPSDSEAKAFLDFLNGGTAQQVQKQTDRAPLERIKADYNENSFRQLAMEIYNAQEMSLAKQPPREHAAAHAARGQEMLAHGFMDEAEREFREAILVDPTNASAHAGLARVLESSDPSNARKEAETANRLQPSVDAYLVLARLALKDNNVQGASENAAQALQLDPKNALALQLKQQIAAKLAEKAQPLPRQ